ncbi:FixH family protein [Pseudomarimonas arenosa]|uniref:FixH family protein n=1 Tax=Pseudomarimonas arenosa TaxID=2774145 RepID=A0AAW3ZQB8_9GAMM|nr:FixH family protein [Pseudomarimonas arenosa]MBD8527337.1 FixH family protein [Pseudomarimonas arenosa]
MSATRPWFQEPMVYLVWGVPLATVIAGLSTLAIAIQAGGSDQVIDQVSRMAQVQQTDVSADHEARRLGLSASLVVSERDVVVELGGRWPTDQPLSLRLSHPTDAAQDHQLSLQPLDGRWTTAAVIDPHIAWQIQLADQAGRWRLDGELNKSRGFATLTPRFSDG